MLLALLLSLAPAAQQPNVVTRVMEVGEHPEDIVVVDLNGDGLQDLVTANWGANSITSLRQLPGRDFGTPISSLVDGVGPSLIAGGDFNGDNLGDLAVLLENSEELIVLQGDGTGQFQQVQRFALPGETTEVEAFDVNHDGKLDLVATNFFFNQLLVWDGLGDGTFAPATGHTPSGLPTWISFGDMDGDGWEDVIVATCSNNAQNVFHGTPEGPLGPPSYIDTAAEQFWNEVADVNGDGKLDLFSADFGSEIWVQQDFPNFQWLHQNDPSINYRLVSGDLNGDGIIDIAANAGDNLIFGYGTGIPSWPEYLTTPGCGDGLDSPRIADLDGDGRDDLVTYCDSDDTATAVFFIPDGLPAVDELIPRELPTLQGNGEVLRVTGFHFDQLTFARLGSTALGLFSGAAPDDQTNTAVIVGPNELHIVAEPLSVQGGELQLTLATAQGTTSFNVPVEPPTEPVLQTYDGDLTFTAGVDDLPVYLGAPAGHLVGLASSPDLIPTPIPGLVDLAIGNGGSSLTTQAWLTLGGEGWDALLYGTLPEFAGLTIHLQSVSVDLGDPELPITPSAPLSVTFQ